MSKRFCILSTIRQITIQLHLLGTTNCFALVLLDLGFLSPLLLLCLSYFMAEFTS